MKKVLAIIIAFFLIALTIVYTGPVKAKPSEKMKGICVHGEDLKKFGVKDTISTFKEYGYNTIFFLVKNPQGKVFYKSKFLPIEDNILEILLDEAHQNNIKVFIYFPVFMDKNFGLTHNEELMMRVNNTTNSYYISFLSDIYLEYVKHFLQEVLQYNIDGFSLDFIRFPNGSYDFSSKFMQYARKNGVDTDKVRNIAYKTFINPADWKSLFEAYENGDKDVIKWIDLRENLVKNEAFIIKDYIKSIKPDVKVGTFIVARGFRYKKIEEAENISDTLTYQIVNFAQLPDSFKEFDFIAPMIYLSSLKETSDYARITIEKIRLDLTQLPIYAAVNPFGISNKETEKELFNAFKYGEGAVLFRFPLFTMGKWAFSSDPVPGENASAKIKISNNIENYFNFVVEQKDFIPSFGNAIFLGPFLGYTSLVFTIGIPILIKNGKEIKMDTAPFIKDSRTFVPVRFVSENLGAKVSWDSKKREVKIEKDDDLLNITIGIPILIKNGKEIKMDTAPFIKDSRTFVPVRFVSENLGAKVSWDSKKREVKIEMFTKF